MVVRASVRTDVDPPAGRRHRRGPLVFDDRADSAVGPVLIVDQYRDLHFAARIDLKCACGFRVVDLE